MRIEHKIAASWIVAVFLFGCATPPAHHSGRRGLFERLAEGGTSGRVSRTPVVSESIDPAEEAREVSSHSPSSADVNVEKVRASARGWRWPLNYVKATSNFGDRGSGFHEGVDLAASQGTAVFAADGGKVIYAGSKISGYGRMVILKHPSSGLLTVYAHLSKPLVKRGQSVKRGQKIALSGATGHASGPHLHFEVRKGVIAIDPMQVLASGPAPKKNRLVARTR